jgi:hypothetical protein
MGCMASKCTQEEKINYDIDFYDSKDEVELGCSPEKYFYSRKMPMC